MKNLILLILCISDINSIAPNKWKGKWFPVAPGEIDSKLLNTNKQMMGVINIDCDDGQTNLAIDYDYKNATHQYFLHMCRESRSHFKPNATIQPVLKEYIIPPEYSALHKCMNESIEYEDRIPTFGTHRPIWPVYGEYIYVPPQRWIHNLEHGAIVLLYHPCANLHQLIKLKEIIKNCLYRHIITSSERLTPNRPYAIVAWGKSLEMSFIDTDIIVDFIKTNALKGPEQISRNGQYNNTLIEMANAITDIDDSVLCPSINR